MGKNYHFLRVFEPFIGGKRDFEVQEVEFESENQEPNGAPVENNNPLGYNLDYIAAFYMVIQGIIGTGIFATPGSIVQSIGSIGASYVLWVVGFLIALFEIFIYIEFVTYFQRRSGGDVAYLEQAYPKPDFLVPTTYAAVSVLLSFLNSSAIAFGTYILNAADIEATTWRQRAIGCGILTFVCVLSSINTRATLRLSNILGSIKVIFIAFIIITGFVTLAGGTRIANPTSIFKNAWEGTTTDGNAISNAIIKVSFSYGGTQYVFGVVGESNPRHTKRMFCFFIPGVVFFIFILYVLIITSYYAGSNGIENIKGSNTLIASLFFQNVFNSVPARKALDALVALSALGHLLAAVIGHSRALRECGRQGVLPYSSLWTTTRPWGTPILPIFATWLVNIIVMIAPPAGDAYNFIVDIGSYSNYIFKLLLVIGLILVRRQRKEAGLGFEGWKVPLPILVVTIFFEVFVIAMAWVPPLNGTLIGSDVSFFYCTYAIVCVGILGICVLYYYIWAKVLPRFGHYEHRILFYSLDCGELGHSVVKVEKDDLQKWDTEHDSNGRPIFAADDSVVELVGTESISHLSSKFIT
ncbi:uncharacterized protein AC631_05775 [Debaryomyces fabryi]|uniref:Amino acid permease/ SLC12A domain-containing protein n=1 Tax=Debaryomyces fabryi TaxID=58627 RepID=A0A0V1PQF4_9ASCO|nr:uncharacterized protein AC631_05775 [Debaryomyces fabryi]KRZ98464.1 hypothetical protein AC631_05775 [Debaryomyces fabryi]CUM45803.1 unnamed protein product [Debaryomyces fabryi]